MIDDEDDDKVSSSSSSLVAPMAPMITVDAQQQPKGTVTTPTTVPSRGPDPIVISRKQIDTLYHLLHVTTKALDQCYYYSYRSTRTCRCCSYTRSSSISNDTTTTAATTTATEDTLQAPTQQKQQEQEAAKAISRTKHKVQYIITGGSLLGAVRQHSILFTDDDIDIAIINDHHYTDDAEDDIDDDDDDDGTTRNSRCSCCGGYLTRTHDDILTCVREQLPKLLNQVASSSTTIANSTNTSHNNVYQYTINAWDGSDRIRYQYCSNVFIDIFCIRKYPSLQDLISIIQHKQNGTMQSSQYVIQLLNQIFASILKTTAIPITSSSSSAAAVSLQTQHDKDDAPTTTANDSCSSNNMMMISDLDDIPSSIQSIFPIYHFDRRKAIELWPKEVYQSYELYPIHKLYKMGPVTNLFGPNMPLTLLYRAFGDDCFVTYYKQICSHHNNNNGTSRKNETEPMRTNTQQPNESSNNETIANDYGSYTKNSCHSTTADVVTPTTNRRPTTELPPHTPSNKGGKWEGTIGYPLLEVHYVPIQPILRHLRRHTNHNKNQLLQYIQDQSMRESAILQRRHQRKYPSSMDMNQNNCTSKYDQNEINHSKITDGIQDDIHANKEIVMNALQCNHNCNVAQQEESNRPRRTVYMDGVFDLFHIGHVHAIHQCVHLGDTIIIGVVSDHDAMSYKRRPVISEKDRIAVVSAMRYVDKVICPCPLIVTEDFMNQWKIDLVVHGFANANDAQKQDQFFRIPKQLNRFQQISYYDKLSTTDIINRIQGKDQMTDSLPVVTDDAFHDSSTSTADRQVLSALPSTNNENQRYFGTIVELATNHSDTIPYDPFPVHLRTVIEQHIQMARTRQNNALESILLEQELQESNSTMTKNDVIELVQHCCPLSVEGTFDFDTKCYPLREKLLECGNFPATFDLTKLHEQNSSHYNKDSLLHSLTLNYVPFQELYDVFVRDVCIPRMVHENNLEEVYYYQSFPCIRIVQPNEFSIGPHSDITYGHHVGSINIYVPLTYINGAASLFLESRYGSEDWHPITGSYGRIKHFPGAACIHWTTNNTCSYTRVSLDFRIVTGTMYKKFANSGLLYRNTFYNCCHWNTSSCRWERLNALLPAPDKRTGFPWTVNNWDYYLNRKKQKQRKKFVDTLEETEKL